MNERNRRQRLLEWEEAPGARFCHPREEHLLPLHICYGLAGRPSSEFIETEMMGKKTSMYLW
jgi:aromatic ring-opening dioxygenase catalytic subunit (LigB family)